MTPTMTRLRIRPLLAAVLMLAGIFAPPAAEAQRPIRVFISVDMEGIGGVVTDQQLGPTGFEYTRFREIMTAEALAAMQGAREAGATEFVIADSHGSMQNLLIDRFPADVRIVRGTGRPLGMMHGIDSTFSAVMFIGYHSATTNPQGVRAHTFSSATLAAVKLNDEPIAESGLNARLAGYFGVPVVLISGDADAVGELQKLTATAGPAAEGAVVKDAIGFHAATVMTPEASQALIRAKAKTAITRLREFKPVAARGAFRVDITFKNYMPAEALAQLPGTERVDAHTVRYRLNSIIDAARFLGFIGNYRADLTP